MAHSSGKPVVHLELHSRDLAGACTFYEELCGWRPERVYDRCGSYLAVDFGRGLGGGMVECSTERPLWLPYVEVPDVHAASERARSLGGCVRLEPREGPAGWRSVVASSSAGEIALWQSKR